VADSNIGWTNSTWNPVVGCTRASEGCDNCYAVRLTKRLEVMNAKSREKYHGLVNPGKTHFNGVVRTCPDDLSLPLGWKKPRRIFVNSMGDLFHKDVPFAFIDQVMAVMAICPEHTFQVLTKRAERMKEYFDQYDPERVAEAAAEIACRKWGPLLAGRMDAWKQEFLTAWDGRFALPLPNVALGVSVENQDHTHRIPPLVSIPAAIRYLSCEPLLGAVDLTHIDKQKSEDGATVGWTDGLTGLWWFSGPGGHGWKGKPGKEHGLHWVIVGGETAPKAKLRPMEVEWMYGIVRQCQAAGVPVFVKQDSGHRPGEQGRISDEVWALKQFPEVENRG